MIERSTKSELIMKPRMKEVKNRRRVRFTRRKKSNETNQLSKNARNFAGKT